MKTILKRLSLVMVLVLAFVVPAFADGQQEAAEENHVIEFAGFEGAYGRVFWEDLIADFQAENPDIEVVSFLNPKIGAVMKPRFLSGDTPDVLYLPQWNKELPPKQLAKEGAIKPLNEFLKGKDYTGTKNFADLFAPGIIDTCTINNDKNIYWLPIAYGGLGLWANGGLLKENGWEVPNTWEEFFALGEKAKAKGLALFCYPGVYPSYISHSMYAALANLGGLDVLKDLSTYEEGAYQHPALLKLFKNLQILHDKGYMLDGTFSMNHTQAQTEFLHGKSLFISNGTWLQNEMKDIEPVGFEYVYVLPLVEKTGGQRFFEALSEAIWVPADIEIEKVERFLKYIYTEKNVVRFAKEAGGLMPVANVKELTYDHVDTATQSWLTNVAQDNVNSYQVQFDTIPSTVTKQPEKELHNCMQAIMAGELTPEEAIKILSDLNKEVNAAQ